MQIELPFGEFAMSDERLSKPVRSSNPASARQVSGTPASGKQLSGRQVAACVTSKADPLRHAQYLALVMRERRIDAATRHATVRALCADLVASLSAAG